MKYIGRHPQEGFPLVESNTLSSASVLKQTNTFIPKMNDISTGGFGQSGMYHDMYLCEIVEMSSSGDSDAMKHKWIDNSGSDIDGEYRRIQAYHGSTSATSGYTTNNTNSSSPYGHNFGTGIGNASDDSVSGFAWWTPFGFQKRTRHRLTGSNDGVWGGDGDFFHVDQATIRKEADAAEGYEIVMHSSSNMTGDLRVYGVPKHNKHHGVWNMNQSNPLINHVNDGYIGNIPSGQGWVKLAESTASDGDTNLDFQSKFTDEYDTYQIVFKDCKPNTDGGRNLFMLYMDGGSAAGAYTDYDGAYHSVDSNGGTGEGHAHDQADLPMLANNTGSNTREHTNGYMLLWPRDSAKQRKNWFSTMTVMEDGTYRAMDGFVSYPSTTAYDGIRFFWQRGTTVYEWESGKIILYGLKKQ